MHARYVDISKDYAIEAKCIAASWYQITSCAVQYISFTPVV